MAKITRATQQIFASAAANNGIFGSAQANAGPGTIAANITQVQSLAAFAQGWLSATIGANKFPPLEEIQSLEWMNTTQLAYLFQEGIPEYDSGTTYFTYSIAKDPASFKIYGSIVDNNIGEALTNGAYWQLLQDLSNPGGLGAATNSQTQTGTSTSVAVTPASLAATIIGGVGQVWTDVTATRSASTVYTNSTGRPIEVFITFNISSGGSTGLSIAGGAYFSPAGQSTGAGAVVSSISFIIPNGITYEITTSGATITKWLECR